VNVALRRLYRVELHRICYEQPSSRILPLIGLSGTTMTGGAITGTLSSTSQGWQVSRSDTGVGTGASHRLERLRRR